MRVRNRWIALLIFVVALIVYGSNDGYLYSYDSAPNLLFVVNLLEHHTLAFDDFRGGYLDDAGAGYVFTTTPSGRLEPIFPIGTALVSAPLYLAEYGIARLKGPFPDITAPAFAAVRLRDEKRAANVIAAFAAALFFLCAARMMGRPRAIAGTIVFAFGSEMWTIGSQALWQHGSIALTTLAMLLAFVSLRDARFATARLIVAGLCAGFLTTIRPTAGLYSLAGAGIAIFETRWRAWIFVCAAFAGALPGLLWNGIIFQSVLGGYSVNATSYTFSLAQAASAGAGLLVSPSRGLLVFSPFVLFAVVGAIRALRERTFEARALTLLAAASVATFASYVFFQRWEGGAAFGPRYLTELMPAAALLAAYALPDRFVHLRRREMTFVAAFACAAALSIGVQVAGVNGDAKTNWSEVPLDISNHPERVWERSDSQIARDARATYDLWTANPTFSSAYAADYNGTIDDVRTDDGRSFLTRNARAFAAGERLTLSATMTNTGASSWYGYRSGYYYGQTRVRVRFFDAGGNLASERDLLVGDDVVAGTHATASGVVDVPARAETYRIAFDIDVAQDARIGSRHVGLRDSTLDVRAR